MKIKNIINEWDPYSLFPYAPDDEYSSEIKSIEEYVNDGCNKNDLNKYIKSLFSVDDISSEKRNFNKIVDKILD